MLQHRTGLLLRDPRKKLHKLRQGEAVFQVFEQGCHRDPGAAEHPGTTDALRITLHCGAASSPEVGLRAHGPIVAGLVGLRSLGMPTWLQSLREPDLDDRLAGHTEPGGLMVERVTQAFARTRRPPRHWPAAAAGWSKAMNFKLASNEKMAWLCAQALARQATPEIFKALQWPCFSSTSWWI